VKDADDGAPVLGPWRHAHGAAGLQRQRLRLRLGGD